MGQPQHARPGFSAPRLLHADGAADDRGGEYLAVFLHTGLWPARSAARTFRTVSLELARRSLNGNGLSDRYGNLERSRVLHDLLSGGAAAAIAGSGGSRC